ncbi:hypothetical protein [Acinetobacter phage P577]|uniref:hypothetical protein n=1 Tax=Acinetobacter phage YMC13/03/R2096 TaxID=1560342 RepID=UPI00052A9C8E|nr:hypothetical protein ACQ36_gp087 [Acinetobacter phage YMC13/03/R2096]AIW02846.1 hypothetical protein BPABA577_01120 [Acinetobacter phage YMC13/03/R2096]WNT46170.1 hypothetical protein [Acinetobacter phage P577]
MTEIVKQEESTSEDEIIKVKKSVVVEYILKDRNKYLRAQQSRYKNMRLIDGIHMRFLFIYGALSILLVLSLLWTIVRIILLKEFYDVLLGAFDVILLFIFVMRVDDALHWWDEEEERTGGYLADTETD